MRSVFISIIFVRPCAAATVLVAFAFSGLVGCSNSQPPPAPQSATMSISLPAITPQDETKVLQPKAGLELSVIPVQYAVEQRQHVGIRQVSPPFATALIRTEGQTVYVEKTTTTSLNVEPEQLRFQVKLNNQMPRVFHGAGAVVQFNVDGAVLPVAQAGYSNLQGAIVPPRQEQQIEIIGPSLSSLKKDKGILGVFLYDVVTKQSEAGVVTEKQNFEWYFNYVREPKPVEVPATRIEHGEMSIPEYQQAMMTNAREQREAAMPQNPGAHPGYPPPGPTQ
jgi:hypothetical protein